MTNPQPQPQQPAAEHISPAIALAARAQLKSTPLAIALAFFFGPLGLLYSSPGWAMILTLLSIPVAFVTIGLGLIPLWIAALVVAALSSERYNKQIIALARRASQLPAR